MGMVLIGFLVGRADWENTRHIVNLWEWSLYTTPSFEHSTYSLHVSFRHLALLWTMDTGFLSRKKRHLLIPLAGPGYMQSRRALKSHSESTFEDFTYAQEHHSVGQEIMPWHKSGTACSVAVSPVAGGNAWGGLVEYTPPWRWVRELAGGAPGLCRFESSSDQANS